MARKTINVSRVRELVNTMHQTKDSSLYLENVTPEQAFRLGAASLLEILLHETGNYRGFAYVETPYVAGVTDETRRSYS